MAKRNIKLILEYDGTHYHGWQRQKNALSIQETVENAIFKMTQCPVRIIAAGRTDAGVHARGQVVNFQLQQNFDVEKLKFGINAHLPEDIIVTNIKEVSIDFHSRFDAKKRIYQYFITRGNTAIWRNYCLQYYQKINTELLNSVAEKLIGRHDFTSFSRIRTENKNKVCQVFESSWREENGFIIYRIAADRFLHGMVRTLVGTMLDVARGYLHVEQFDQIFLSKNRKVAGKAAPAKGLFLETVEYN